MNIKDIDLANVIEKKVPPCQSACPALTDIPGYIRLIAEGRYDEAYLLNREANIFPSICGRVCTHPCAFQCNRRSIRDEDTYVKRPVQIMLLKRFASDYSSVINERRSELFHNEIPAGARKVAIIGSGPAGLAAANDLALMKYDVTVFEKSSEPGGLMMTVLPDFRIQKEIVRLEISFIEDLGVKIRTGVEVGRDVTIEGLRSEGFEAIFVAVGMQDGRGLGLDGDDAEGIYDSLVYLRAAVAKESIKGESVLVIGGGNAAMDAARAAVRLGAREVHIGYRGKWDPGGSDHMPASFHEYSGARDEGVAFHFSRMPSRVDVENGRVKGVEFKGVKKVYDLVDGKKIYNPVFDESVKEYIKADVVVTAIGQAIDGGFAAGHEAIAEKGWVDADPVTLQTSVKHIFSGGDAFTGPRSIISAVGTGHRAAVSIDRFLRGVSLSEEREEQEFELVEHSSGIELARSAQYNWEGMRPAPYASYSIEDSRKSFEMEISSSLVSRVAAEAETLRCMQCDNKWTYDLEQCIYCGGCVDICPQDCLSLVRRKGNPHDAETEKFFSGGEWHESGDSYVKQDAQRCIHCGACSQRCPTGAIRFERYKLRRRLGMQFMQKVSGRI